MTGRGPRARIPARVVAFAAACATGAVAAVGVSGVLAFSAGTVRAAHATAQATALAVDVLSSAEELGCDGHGDPAAAQRCVRAFGAPSPDGALVVRETLGGDALTARYTATLTGNTCPATARVGQGVAATLRRRVQVSPGDGAGVLADVSEALPVADVLVVPAAAGQRVVVIAAHHQVLRATAGPDGCAWFSHLPAGPALLPDGSTLTIGTTA